MKPKCRFHYRICPIERDHVYLVQENRFWTKSKQSVLNKTNSERYQNVLVSFPKRYRNVCPFFFDITLTVTLTCDLFSDFKYAKKIFFKFFSYHLPTGKLSSILKFSFFAKILCKNFVLNHYFSPLNTFMRKGKDPDQEPEPDPNFLLIDPDPGGPKTCGSCGSGSPILFGSGIFTSFYVLGCID
jgi:hypothetical protein